MDGLWFRLSLWSAILTTLAAGESWALESTAGSASPQASTAGLEARLEAGIGALQTSINSILRCNNKGRVFASAPSAPGKDSDGCVAVEASRDPSLSAVLYCNSIQQTYDPGNPKADAVHKCAPIPGVAEMLYCNSIQKTYDPTAAMPPRDAYGCAPIPGVSEMLYCNSVQAVYDPGNPLADAVHKCVPVATGKLVAKEVRTAELAINSGASNTTYSSYSSKAYDVCVQDDVYFWTNDNGAWGCQMQRNAAGQWRIRASRTFGYEGVTCRMTCFDSQ